MKTTRLLLAGLIGLAVPMAGSAQPTITTQPKSQSVSLGADVTLSVRASGAAPLSYQWRCNAKEIAGAGTNALSLTNVTLSAAGDYLAVVSDATGLSSTSRVATLSVDPAFIKITGGGIVTDRGLFAGSSWADYDNDGFLDLLVSNFGGGGNFLYRNNHNETFSRINASPIGTDPEHTIRCAWGDYDNDGFVDLATLNGAASYSEANVLYHNNGDGTFSRMIADAVGELASAKGNCHGGAWGDFNNDGFLDLMVVDWNRKTVLYRNHPDGRFAKVVGDPLVNVGSQSVGCAWADFDNDGWSDAFVSGFGGANFLLRNDGHGAFLRITGRVPASDTASSDGCAWGDYNNDGFLDLFVTNPNSGGNRLYRNKGDGTFEKITAGAVVADRMSSTGCAWGDYDNDGWLDLFVVNGFSGPQNNLLYRNNGDGTFTKITAGSPVNDSGNSFGVGWGDYDNDGFLDLFVANGILGPAQSNFLYRNSANTNGWLKVECVGTVSNRAGIGAKVRVKSVIGGQARWQLRAIDGGDGTSGGSLEAHFGLGDATIVDTLRIEWPSGIEQELRDVAANQFLTVTEPVRLQVSGPGVFRVQSWKGMAFEMQASTDLVQWLPLTTVTNLTGTLDFTDQDATNHLQRFYRTVLR
ncbi:MAG: FG-GAP-like repeat-containing protein [Verrucomicrobiales bacterium]|nr:FG-GAP-like repeat-containing protein [Verrucomicrobiales bacterium]